MKPANFDSFRQLFDEDCFRTLAVKGKDYSSNEDRLANFKRLAERLNVSPMVIWSVYWTKHVDAILHFASNGKVESEPIRERFVDARNYLDLGLALIHDIAELAEAKKP